MFININKQNNQGPCSLIATPSGPGDYQLSIDSTELKTKTSDS
jgi:hypothetical protein